MVTKSPVISEKFHHILLILNTPTDKQQGLTFAINNKKGVEQRYAQMHGKPGKKGIQSGSSGQCLHTRFCQDLRHLMKSETPTVLCHLWHFYIQGPHIKTTGQYGHSC
ncbi:hypothetical protein U0070_010089, partial [Myodes glareolus]